SQPNIRSGSSNNAYPNGIIQYVFAFSIVSFLRYKQVSRTTHPNIKASSKIQLQLKTLLGILILSKIALL
ncbi:hypothetical protein, partial [Vibrio sp. 10N.237.312.B06]|uniref:hypothetical protein n=1 Tax=Vibrio sp. 10N.237.312.B06 TaxID=3229974 RepID=UPI00354BA624